MIRRLLVGPNRTPQVDSRPYSLKKQKPESQTRAAWPVGVKKNTMKNWALTNWPDWFERQREGREGPEGYTGTLQSRPERFPPKAEGQDQKWKLYPAYRPRPKLQRRRRKMGRRRQELQIHKELGDKPVCDRNFVSVHHSLSSSHSSIPGLPLTSVSSQALGSPLPGTKRSSPTPSCPTRVRAGKPVWEPQEARILLESGKSLNRQAPRARSILPNTQDERNM